MSQPRNGSEEDVRALLQKARGNQARWLEMSPGLSAEPGEIQQWATIANLRRREVERLEELIAQFRGMSGRAGTEVQSKTTPKRFGSAH